jgi:hypothetical protein
MRRVSAKIRAAFVNWRSEREPIVLKCHELLANANGNETVSYEPRNRQ